MAAVFGPSPAEVEVQSSSGSVTVEVVGTMGGGWTATTVADWVTISPASGSGPGYFTVSYTQNTDTDNSRVAIVDIVGYAGTSEFTLTQEAASAPSGGNIFVGSEGIVIMLGNDEIPAIYCGEELLYPINLGTLTGITLENITWVTDVPSSGGTATEENCSYKVVGHYDSGKNKTVTNQATVTGSLAVSATTAETREAVGTLELTATYEGFSASGSVTAYQENYSRFAWVEITQNFDRSIPFTKVRFDLSLTNQSWYVVVSGGTSYYPNGYFSESPNVNCDGKGWRDITGSTYGYAGQNRFRPFVVGTVQELFSCRVCGFVDKRIPLDATLISGQTYEYTYPVSLYWGGIGNITTPYTEPHTGVFVYIEVPGVQNNQTAELDT